MKAILMRASLSASTFTILLPPATGVPVMTYCLEPDERFAIHLPQMMQAQHHKESTRPPRKQSLSLCLKYIILAMTNKTGQVIL